MITFPLAIGVVAGGVQATTGGADSSVVFEPQPTKKIPQDTIRAGLSNEFSIFIVYVSVEIYPCGNQKLIREFMSTK